MKKETFDKIVTTAENTNAGQFFSICYKTDMTPYLKEKDKSYKLWKITNTTVRTGVNYGHIEAVKEANAKKDNSAPKRKVTNNCTWIIDNKVKFNTSTNKYYLRVATLNSVKKSSSYIIERFDETGSRVEILTNVPKSIVEQILKDSKSNPSAIKDISFENIIRINNTVFNENLIIM